MFTHGAHNPSALTHDFSQHEERRAVSQCIAKQSNLHNLFGKVTQIFCSKIKSNALLYWLL